MRFLIYVSILFLLLISCRTAPNADLMSLGTKVIKESDIPSYFQSPEFSKALFKAEISIMGIDLSGLIMFKKVNDSTHRVTFFNELGMNFFDMEFIKGKGKVINIAQVINYDKLINSLVSDLNIILSNDLIGCKAEVLNNEKNHSGSRESSYSVYKLSQKIGPNSYFYNDLDLFYWINNQSRHLDKIQTCTSSTIISTVYYSNIVNRFPTAITIERFDFDLMIKLELIDEN